MRLEPDVIAALTPAHMTADRVKVEVLSAMRQAAPGGPSSALATEGLHGLWSALTSSPWTGGILLALVFSALVRGARAVLHPSGRRDPVRRFSPADKAIILERAGHRCEHHGWLSGRCHVVDQIEADHVHPHSRGGQTAVANGQALCKAHNRSKRARVPYRWELRALQRRRGG